MYLYLFSATNETSPVTKEAGRKEGSTQQTTSPLSQSMPTFLPIDTYLTQGSFICLVVGMRVFQQIVFQAKLVR